MLIVSCFNNPGLLQALSGVLITVMAALSLEDYPPGGSKCDKMEWRGWTGMKPAEDKLSAHGPCGICGSSRLNGRKPSGAAVVESYLCGSARERARACTGTRRVK